MTGVTGRESIYKIRTGCGVSAGTTLTRQGQAAKSLREHGSFGRSHALGRD